MLRKEFREIIKPVLITVFVLVLIPFLYKILPGFMGRSIENLSESMGILQTFDLYLIALIITRESGVFGSSIFRSEYRDNAFEYLFSSPIQVSRVLTIKAVTRLSALMIFLTVYIFIFYSHTDIEVNSILTDSIFLNPKFFISWIMFLFFISLFPSIFKKKNWIAITSLVTLLSIFILPIALKKILLSSKFRFTNNNDTDVLVFMIGMAVVFIISCVAFYFSYKRIDLKESFFEGNRYVLIALIPQIVLIVISILVFIK